MSECEYCHEGGCILEVFLTKIPKKHPCKFARLLNGNKVVRTCTATDKDLVEVGD